MPHTNSKNNVEGMDSWTSVYWNRWCVASTKASVDAAEQTRRPKQPKFSPIVKEKEGAMNWP